MYISIRQYSVLPIVSMKYKKKLLIKLRIEIKKKMYLHRGLMKFSKYYQCKVQ